MVCQVEQGTLRIPLCSTALLSKSEQLKVIVIYLEPGIRTIPQPVMYVPSFPQLPPLSQRCKRSCEVINPTAHKDFPQICLPLFRVVVLSPQPRSCTKLSVIQTTKIKTPKTGKSRSGIAQKLHNILVMTSLKKCIILLENHIWRITFGLLHNPLGSFFTISWRIALNTEYTCESLSYREHKH